MASSRWPMPLNGCTTVCCTASPPGRIQQPRRTTSIFQRMKLPRAEDSAPLRCPLLRPQGSHDRLEHHRGCCDLDLSLAAESVTYPALPWLATLVPDLPALGQGVPDGWLHHQA